MAIQSDIGVMPVPAIMWKRGLNCNFHGLAGGAYGGVPEILLKSLIDYFRRKIVAEGPENPKINRYIAARSGKRKKTRKKTRDGPRFFSDDCIEMNCPSASGYD